MNYIPLSKMYFKNRKQYYDLYSARANCSDAVYNLPVEVTGNPAFFIVCHEVICLTTEIYIRNNKLTRIYNSPGLPPVAIKDYIQNAIVEEIMQTNTIEGVRSTRKEIQITFKKRHSSANLRFKGLVNQYNQILDFDHKTRLASSTDIRVLYDDMLGREIPEDCQPDGIIFRKESVSVLGADGKAIHRGLLPEEHLIDFVNASLSWVQDDSIPHLLRASVFHYLLEYAHPFYDGNGRLGRFITSQQLKETLNVLVSFRISSAINGAKEKYYKAFEICNHPRNCGDITPFVIVFLEILLMAVNSLIDDLETREERLAHYAQILEEYFATASTGKKALQEERVLDAMVQAALFIRNDLTIEDLCQEIQDLSKYQIRNILDSLEIQGLASSKKSGKYKLYTANLSQIEKLTQSTTTT